MHDSIVSAVDVGVPPSISVDRARLDYGGRPLFKDLSLHLAGGHWTCLLGPSGVGKSSLLRMIAGLVRGGATTSIAADDGRPLAGRIAYMAQQDLLLPWLSVLDNVCLGPRLRRSRRHGSVTQGRVLLEAVGLSTQASARPNTLSGGMRQRAALARTLFEQRPVVLMDEPFSAVDAITRLRLQSLATDMLRDRTVLLVTHDPWEALRVADTVLVMTGNPARVSATHTPPGCRPRRHDDPGVVALHARLLADLDV